MSLDMSRTGRLDKLALHAQRSCVCPSDYLQLMSMRRRKLTGGVSYALFSSLPVQNTLRAPWFHRLVLIVALPTLIVNLYNSGRAWGEGTIPAFRHYKFSSLEQRNGSVVPESPGIAKFGLLRKGETEGRRVSNEGWRLPCVASDAEDGRIVVRGASMTLSLAAKAETRYEMWFIRTLEEGGTEGKDALKFILEGSDDEEVWTMVGSSTSVRYFNVVAFTNATAKVPEGRGRRHVIDARMTVAHWLGNHLPSIILWASVVVCMCAAACGAHHTAMRTLVAGYVLQFLARLVMGLVLHWQEHRDGSHHAHSTYLIVLSFASLFAAVVLVFFQIGVELPMIISPQPFMQVYLHRQLFGTPFSLSPASGSMVQSLVIIGVGFFVLFIRLKILISAQRRIVTARAIYDGEWQRVCQEHRADVERLAHTVAKLQFRCRNTKALQLNQSARWVDAVAPSTPSGSVSKSASLDHHRASSPQGGHGSPTHVGVGNARPELFQRPRAESIWLKSLNRVAPGVHSPANLKMAYAPAEDEEQMSQSYLAMSVLQSRTMARSLMKPVSVRCTQAELDHPVGTLDQLHSQAFFVHDIFQSWVVDLARRNEGKFRLRQPKVDGDGAERLFEAWDGGEDARGRFKLGRVKPVKSAMCKLDMAYNDDVSRLLDMSRETLYFDTVALLEGCLSDLEKDEMVDIVLVKSSMLAQRDGERDGEKDELRAGMPFVRVNVRMAGSEEARSLCVDAHVCELLLVLTDIAKLQTMEMYNAYRYWRMSSRVANVYWRLKKRVMPRRKAQSRVSTANDGVLVAGGEKEAEPSQHAPMSFDQPAGPLLNEDATTKDDGGKTLAIEATLEDEHQRWQGGETSWGVKIGPQMEELLEGLARMSVVGVFDFLDLKWKSVANGDTKDCFESSSFSGLFFSRHPFTAASTRLPFRIFLVGSGMWVLGIGLLAAVRVNTSTQDYVFGPYKHYRLETMLTRNGSVGRGVMGPGVSEFGLVGISGCSPYGSFPPEEGDAPEPVPSSAGPLGSSYVVTYPQGGASITGWYLRTLVAEGSEGQDPSYFNVWATNQDYEHVWDGSCALGREDDRWWVGGDQTEWCGARWTRVGAPHWRWNADSFTTIFQSYDFVQMTISLPMARGALELWQLSPNGFLYHPYYTMPYFLVGSGLIISGSTYQFAFLQFSRFVPSPHITVALGLVLSCISISVGFVYAALTGVHHHLFELGFCVLSFVPLLAAFMWSGNIFLYGMWCYAIFWTGFQISQSILLFHSAYARPPTVGIIVALLALAVSVSRWRAMRSSQKLVAQDEVKYDSLWQSLCETEESKASILHLENVVRMVGLDSNNVCRQQMRLKSNGLVPATRALYLSQASGRRDIYPLFWDTGDWFIPGRTQLNSKVSSMNQLYAESAVANLLLTERIKVWADGSSGMVQLLGDVQVSGVEVPVEQQMFVRWSQVKNDPDMLRRVKWPVMKRHTRALEKLLRIYKNDPSHLVDVARNCLIFNNVNDLTICLGLIITDDNVRVERVKNRMSSDYDKSLTGGYRDVCLNLRIVSKDAQSLGAEQAVCEVQLLLESFARLKSQEGHLRYVIARNSRAT